MNAAEQREASAVTALAGAARPPCTRASLAAEFRALGVVGGMTLLVHSSLSSLGWVCGGSTAVVQALLDVVGEEGTLVAPAFTADNSDPRGWSRPPVPGSWHAAIREHTPAFDAAITPSRGVGRVAEALRTWPGAQRSGHPQSSFSALGRHASAIASAEPREASLGDGSPLARVGELGGHVLLLGVGHDRNTSLHLGEVRAGTSEWAEQGAAVLEDEDGDGGGAEGRRRRRRRVWRTFRDVAYDSDAFPAIGAAFEAAAPAGTVRVGRVGAAEARLFPQPAAVDFAEAWLRGHASLAKSIS